MISVGSFESQEKLVKLIRSMMASGMITDIPIIEIPMIELSTVKQTKPSTITKKSITCSAGKKEEQK